MCYTPDSPRGQGSTHNIERVLASGTTARIVTSHDKDESVLNYVSMWETILLQYNTPGYDFKPAHKETGFTAWDQILKRALRTFIGTPAGLRLAYIITIASGP